jgi:hypothetical protein
MINIVKKNILTITGVLIGAIAGFLYWKYVVCTSGTCYIQSNPNLMTLYGALLGGIIFSIFQPKPTSNQQREK